MTKMNSACVQLVPHSCDNGIQAEVVKNKKRMARQPAMLMCCLSNLLSQLPSGHREYGFIESYRKPFRVSRVGYPMSETNILLIETPESIRLCKISDSTDGSKTIAS